jgi:NTP pyrophosphatase (non-canonical NTP hydrolase)
MSPHYLSTEIRKTLNQVATECYGISAVHGFHTPELDRFSEKIALAHSELSEALEADRIGDPASDKIRTSSRAEELADAVIRIFDMAVMAGIDIGEAISLKMEYNKLRPLRHGKDY